MSDLENIPSPGPAPLVAAPRPWRNPWLYVTVAALGLAGWQWQETRQMVQEARQGVAERLAEHEAADTQSRSEARTGQVQLAALENKVGSLDGKVNEFQAQAVALQGLYQDLARGRDDALLLEVEQGLDLAALQLQVAGNVAGAVLALQAADAKLARLDRPQYLPLRKALAKDMDRLRAVPFVDVPGVSLKLENVVAACDRWPLALDQRPPLARPAVVAPAESPWWARLGSSLWQELQGLVRIQRFDGAAPVLLAPEQVFFLRENLKLRLLNARLALLSRDPATFRNELKLAQEALGRYFDSRDPGVVAAAASLKLLAGTAVGLELPSLNESLSALRAVKNGKEKK